MRAIILIFALMLTITACGKNEDTTTTSGSSFTLTGGGS